MRDGHARRGLVGHLRHVGALHAVLGVVQRVQVAGRQGRDGLGADHHAGLLDDIEHLRNAVVDLADQPALGGLVVLAQRQLAGGRDLQAHLVLDVGDVHAVALADLAGLEVEEELRHEEQRQTLGARACALGAGQHQVEDVLEQVAGVTRGDEALHTVDVPGAVVLLDGLGAAGADVGAGVGLGQHHGGAPAALGGDDGPLLLLVGAEVVEDVGETCATAVHPHGRVGAEDVLVQRPHERLGRGHAAEFLVEADAVPAAVEHGAHRLLERLGQRHRVRLGIEGRGVAVAVGERFGDRTLGQPGHLAEHLAGGVDVQIGVLALAERLVEAEDLEQVEYLVTNVALVVAHVSSSSRMPLVVGYFWLSYPPVTAPELYRPVTSTQSSREQFPSAK